MRSTLQVSDAAVTLEESSGPTAARARDVTLLVAGLSVAATCAAVFFGLWQARRLARPVADLVSRAEALGRGEFTADATATGVPEIDRVAQVLDRSARQLGVFVDLQQQFAADAAHQLRTPLTSIGLHLDEIAQLGDREVQVEAQDAIAQVERLEGVIAALLARARGDSADPVVLDLGGFVAAAASPWARLLRRKGRLLAMDVEPGVTVRARKAHLIGVLGALLDNAVTYGAGDVRVTVARHDGNAQLLVCDDGPGVPPHLTDTLFERRVSGSHGTGIGLSLARSLAAAESGTLSHSADAPARFVMTLPTTTAKPVV
jgi:signal transduction histidine kinase